MKNIYYNFNERHNSDCTIEINNLKLKMNDFWLLSESEMWSDPPYGMYCAAYA